MNEYTESYTVPTQYKVFFTLSLFCGFRKGETLALHWNDIDLREKKISISKSVGMTENGFDYKEPKTKKSVRKVSIPDDVIPLLKKYHSEYIQTRFSHGTAWRGDFSNGGNLFIQADGKLMGHTTPYQYFTKHLHRYNEWVQNNPDKAKSEGLEELPIIPLHGLRHSCATLLNYLEVNIIEISKTLGHSTCSTTMNIYPNADSFIKPFVGSQEFIKGKIRFCLWLKGVSPKEYRGIPDIMERLKKVAEVRRKTKTVAVQALAEVPMLFAQIRQPDSNYILIPETSSSSRKYIPIGFMQKEVIASNSTLVATGASIYHFGILTSNVHMAWMRTVCGRLKSDYRYSPSVYNNFPWPTPTNEQRAKIEQTAQSILDARALYPDCSLADLYDEATMPPELRKAHQQNDKAVMQAYGFWGKLNTESACVAELMKMYQKLAERGVF